MNNEFSAAGTLPLETRDVFDATRAKLVFEADVFWARESIGPEAEQCVANLRQVLLAARKSHSAVDYALLARPVLLEVQQREQEILEYLSSNAEQQRLAS